MKITQEMRYCRIWADNRHLDRPEAPDHIPVGYTFIGYVNGVDLETGDMTEVGELHDAEICEDRVVYSFWEDWTKEFTDFWVGDPKTGGVFELWMKDPDGDILFEWEAELESEHRYGGL